MKTLALLLSLCAGALSAASFTVTNFDDAGAGSLRDAIEQANTAPGPHEILFDSGLALPASITLQTALPDITESLTILAPPSKDLIVERATAAPAFRLFTISNADVEIRNLWIGNGRVEGTPVAEGGAIRSQGALTLQDCLVFDSVAIGESVAAGAGGAAWGGGIYADGDLTLIDSFISGCVARGGDTDDIADNAGQVAGGGIYMASGELLMLRSGIGGCAARGGENTADALNSGIARGAGIFGGMALIQDSGISGCSIISDANTIEGGAVVLSGASTIRRGSIHENIGGGLVASADVFIENSTISSNTGTYTGGMLILGGTTSLRYCTIYLNSGAATGGIEVSGGALETEGSIIAGNSGPAPDVNGAATDQDFNLIGDNTGSSGFTVSLLVGSMFNEIDPGLGALQGFGGFSAGHVPFFGGFAHDRGGPGAPFDDQRKANRALGGVPDIGAAEFLVNLPPDFTAGPRVKVKADGDEKVIAAWATNITPGATWEAGQELTFHFSGPTWAFDSDPEIDPATGDLTFTPRSGNTGTFRFDVWLTDNGGTAQGGENLSEVKRLTIELERPSSSIPDDDFDCSTGTRTGGTAPMLAILASLALLWRRRFNPTTT